MNSSLFNLLFKPFRCCMKYHHIRWLLALHSLSGSSATSYTRGGISRQTRTQAQIQQIITRPDCVGDWIRRSQTECHVMFKEDFNAFFAKKPGAPLSQPCDLINEWFIFLSLLLTFPLPLAFSTEKKRVLNHLFMRRGILSKWIGDDEAMYVFVLMGAFLELT